MINILRKYLKRTKNTIYELYKKTNIPLDYLLKQDDILYIPDLNVIFKKIPKASCSKITYIFMKFYFPDINLKEFTKKEANYFGGIHLISDNISKIYTYGNFIKKNTKDIFKFSFVRNPYTRILSAYLNKIKEGANLYQNPSSQKKILRTHSEYIKEYFHIDSKIKRDLGQKLLLPYNKAFKPISFEQFINYIDKQKKKTLNRHFIPQHIYLQSNIIKYDFIGKVENFKKDITFVLKEINAPERLFENLDSKINTTTKVKLSTYYNNKIQEAVYKIYKKDFELFNYSKKLPEFKD